MFEIAKVFLFKTSLILLAASLTAIPSALAEDHPFGTQAPTDPGGVVAMWGAIIEIDPASLECAASVSFDDMDGDVVPGTHYGAVFESDNAAFGERFAGQDLSYDGDYDILSATADGPLNLATGATDQNLCVLHDPVTESQVLCGVGPVGWPVLESIGEGSFAVLFDYDQSEFGFDLMGGSGGPGVIHFFRRDGSLLDAIEIPYLSMTSYGFRTITGEREIAGISIHNIDPGGIGFDNLCHDVGGVVGYPPICNVTGDTYGDAGAPIQYDASASFDPDGEIVHYAWDFDDGNTANGPSPVHTFEEDGNYDVSVCLTDDEGLVSCCHLENVVENDGVSWGTLKSLYR